MTLPDDLRDELERMERRFQPAENDVDLTEEEKAGVRAIMAYKVRHASEEETVPSTEANALGLTQDGLDAALDWIDDDLEAAVVERWGSA